MFFRREKPREQTFEDRLENLRQFGFKVDSQGPGKSRVSKLGCAAIIEDQNGMNPKIARAGVQVGDEIGVVVNGGFQMFLQTESGRRVPALATHLKALHEFQEDLKEGLGIISLYNTSLGTVSDRHMYDRVKGRDKGATPPTGNA